MGALRFSWQYQDKLIPGMRHLLFCGLIYKNLYLRLYGTDEDDLWMMNWIGHGRKKSWPNWGINLASAYGMRKTTKTSKITLVLTKTQSRHLPNTSLGQYHYTDLISGAVLFGTWVPMLWRNMRPPLTLMLETAHSSETLVRQLPNNTASHPTL